MKPFVLKQHQKDSAKVRELSSKNLELIRGGIDRIKLNTWTMTPDGCNDDGSDEP